MGLTRTTNAARLPITIAEARKHVRFTREDAEEDAYIRDLMETVVDKWQRVTNTQLIDATYSYTCDRFSDVMELPVAPLSSVTQVQYVDPDGATQVLAGTVYDVDTSVTPGVIFRDYNQSWPAIRSFRDAITITFVAGYGGVPSDVPAPIRTALLQMVAFMYEHRGEEDAKGSVEKVVGSVMATYRNFQFR